VALPPVGASAQAGRLGRSDFPDREETDIMASKGTCKAASCGKEVRAKGYCDRHYRAWRRGTMGKPRHRSCNEKSCGKAPVRRGLCADHFAKRGTKAAAEAAPS
jgi:hypothetical protein